jgi:L-ornithine Nalpha-acyltransferase
MDRWGTKPIGRLGMLEVRLARGAVDVSLAQGLRYQVFHRERSTVAGAATQLRRDIDEFDAVCDHLLVIDQVSGEVAGTCRLLRQDAAERNCGFYSAAEFRVDLLVERHREKTFLEVGRSCVSPSYRHRHAIELLWHGVWTYVIHHRSDVMIGCASLPGNDPDRLARALSYLHHYASAREPWTTGALKHLYVEMNRIPKSALEVQTAMRELPPLIRGYLRLGASIANGAVIDARFGTIDVLTILPVTDIRGRYVRHFGPRAERYSIQPMVTRNPLAGTAIAHMR